LFKLTFILLNKTNYVKIKANFAYVKKYIKQT
jgi:hypothetical protein